MVAHCDHSHWTFKPLHKHILCTNAKKKLFPVRESVIPWLTASKIRNIQGRNFRFAYFSGNQVIQTAHSETLECHQSTDDHVNQTAWGKDVGIQIMRGNYERILLPSHRIRERRVHTCFFVLELMQSSPLLESSRSKTLFK